MTSYVLLASVMYLRQEDGSRRRHVRGDIVTGIPAEEVPRLIKAGTLAIHDDTSPPVEVAHEVEAAPEPPAVAEAAAGLTVTGRPPKIASKPVLVNWLVEHTSFARAELEEQTKSDLWSLIDATD